MLRLMMEKGRRRSDSTESKEVWTLEEQVKKQVEVQEEKQKRVAPAQNGVHWMVDSIGKTGTKVEKVQLNAGEECRDGNGESSRFPPSKS